MEGVDAFRSHAFQLLTSRSVAEAFDLSREPAPLRERYGRHRWGQSCLLARRLAEAGAAVINIDATATCDTSKNFSWDDHAGAFHLDYAQRERLPQMDQALSALLDDLAQRSLSRRVLVLACGEFGPDATRLACSGQFFQSDRPGPRPLAASLQRPDRRRRTANGRSRRRDELEIRIPHP